MKRTLILDLETSALTPESGDIFIYEDNIVKARSEGEKNRIRSRLGVLFQSAALLDSLTVYDNVAFPLIERSLCPRGEIHGRVCEMLKSLGLEP